MHALLVYNDGSEQQRVHVLEGDKPVTVGRTRESDLAVTWDEGVSRRHARFELVGDDPVSDWTVVDDAPSRNGTFVNGRRVRGRARLGDGDTVAFADTAMRFCAGEGAAALAPPAAPSEQADLDSPTIVANVRLTPESLSDGERRVLAALARPVRAAGGTGAPATDEQVARETYLGAETIRRTVSGLCGRLGLEALPEDEQRRLLVLHALRSGALGRD